MTRIHEDPRVTLPYTDQQWEAHPGAGVRDRPRDLRRRHPPHHGRRADLRLHRRHGRRGVEHRGARAGEAELAERLLDRLRDRFAPGGLLHYGQGKWYPGEPLPRWALACYWRADGVPLWHDRALLAREGAGNGFGPLDAQRFAETLARRLGVDPEYVNPPSKILSTICNASGSCPINVDPGGQSPGGSLKSASACAGSSSAGSNTPTAIVLPLQRGSGPNGSGVADRAVDAARPASVLDSRRFAGRPAAAAAESAVGGGVGGSAVSSRRSRW